MARQTNARPLITRDLAALFRGFHREEQGSMTIFAGFMIFCMIMFGGIALDMMRHEMDRTRLQATADRAGLAGAALTQELAPEAVVTDHFGQSGSTGLASSSE